MYIFQSNHTFEDRENNDLLLIINYDAIVVDDLKLSAAVGGHIPSCLQLIKADALKNVFQESGLRNTDKIFGQMKMKLPYLI